MAMPTGGAFPVARRELWARTALVLEVIALRHQIAVLELSELVARASVLRIGCFGSCCRSGGGVERKPSRVRKNSVSK